MIETSIFILKSLALASKFLLIQNIFRRMNNMNVKMILGDKGTDVLTIDSSNKLSDAIAVLENRSVGILVTTSHE